MRRPVDRAGLEAFIHAVGRAAHFPARVYFVGGATAVLHGWRDTTADIDLRCIGDEDLAPTLSRLRDELEVCIELTSPDQFIPPLPGWEERSPFIGREGPVDFLHYDLYSQALAKIERGFARDLADVREMVDAGLVEKARLLECFEEIRGELPRFPAIDVPSFERGVRELCDAR
jgi:hypothetical protein